MDSTNVLLVFGTFVLAGITLYGVYASNKNTQVSNKHTEKSNELYGLEIEERFKPFLDVSQPIKIEKDGEKYFFHPKISILGNIPVHQLTVNYFVAYESYDFDTLVLNEETIKENTISDEGTLFPGLQLNLVKIPITKEEAEKENLYVVLWMEFEYMNNLKEEQIFAITLKHGKSIGFGNFTLRDVEKVKKRLSERNMR